MCDGEVSRLISKSSEYALRAIALLGDRAGTALPADVVSEKTKVPRRYLHRVLQDLAAAGIVRSRPGPGGGYELLQDPATLTMLDVVNAVSPLERIHKCPLGLPSHHKLCPLHAELDKAVEATEVAFANVTIKQLLESRSRVAPLCDVAAGGIPLNNADRI